MLKKSCCLCTIIGLVLSIAAAVVAGVMISTVAFRWLRLFLIAIWILTALSLLGATVTSIINVYNENRKLTKILRMYIPLLFVGAVSAIIATAVLTLMIDAGTVTVFALKFLTAISALSAGLVMTADVCFVYGLVFGCRRRVMMPVPCQDERRKE